MSDIHPSLSPGQKTLQVDIPLLLPGLETTDDGCIGRLETQLRAQNGIEGAHLDQLNGKPVMCLHFDPAVVQREKVEQLARDQGHQISQRFQHENLPVKGMGCSSCSVSLERGIAKLPGVTQVSVNYAAARLQIEYDTTQITREEIVATAKRLGYEVPAAVSPSNAQHSHGDGHHHAHSEGGHWLLSRPELSMALSSGLFLTLGYFGGWLFHWPVGVSIAFYLLAYIAGGYDLARHALPTVVSGRFDVDFLMLAGAVGAALIGDFAEGAFLLFLFSLGHALEGYALDRARGAIAALARLSPQTARVRRGQTEIEIPVEALKLGDLAIVRPGDRVAVDGTIRNGASSLDQSPITGESVPVEKTVGEGVFAGSINGHGALEVEVTRLSHDTTLARVVKMVAQAQGQKAASQTFAERFERVFVPIVLGTVVLAAILPPVLGILSWKIAFLRAISTLVAASPCALALATPAAVLSGIARAARGGVLIKGGIHLENLGQVRAFAFDKTGTLTRGRPEIASIFALETKENRVLQLAASLEAHSSHPLGQAVVRRAQELNLDFQPAAALQDVPGRGVVGQLGAQTLRLGNLRLFEEAKIAVPPSITAEAEKCGEMGQPTMILSVDERIIGLIALADPIREAAPAALRQLRDLGVSDLIMLTGDNARVATKMAEKAGVSSFRADLLPENKVAAVRELMESRGAVAMIGDGVNDAPALATATVGIAMGAGGSDVALETADVALMGDDLSRLPFAVALSRQSRAIVKQNLWIALGVISLLVPATLFGFARLGVAVVFHEGSTIVVCLNALRLLTFRFEPRAD